MSDKILLLKKNFDLRTLNENDKVSKVGEVLSLNTLTKGISVLISKRLT